MKRKKHTPEQIVRKLREADAALAGGETVAEISKGLSISEQAYYRWRNQYGGMKPDEMKRLKALEKENSRLKRIVADLTLDKEVLNEALRGNY